MEENSTSTKNLKRPSKNITEPFYNLTSYHRQNRNSAAVKLIFELKGSKDNISYCLERLIKGLASPRENARVGFSVALTELLKSSKETSAKDVFALLDKFLPTKAAGENTKNNVIGQLLCLTALIRSKKCVKAMDETVEKLTSIIADRPYMEPAWSQAIVSLALLADEESFREKIFPAIKSQCASNFDTCSPNALWIILELDKLHEKYMRKKVKLFRDGQWPPVDQKGWNRLGEILAAGTKSIPSGVHPLERAVLASMIAGNQFEDFWNGTVSAFLLKHDDKRIVSIGIRMIGNALKMQPGKKQLKSILSTETLEFLLKSLIDRRQAARFARSIASTQLDSILEFVQANKANPPVQFFVFKKFLDLSLNFDGVSASNLIHRLSITLAPEAASSAVDDLLERYRSISTVNDGKPQTDTRSPASESIIIFKLLARLFECSKSNYAAPIVHEYRSKILKLLSTSIFHRIDQSKSVVSGQDESTARNIFMRCLDDLCLINHLKFGGRMKFEFPAQSIGIMSELIESIIDRKSKKLRDGYRSEAFDVGGKRGVENAGAKRLELAANAAKIFHQLDKSIKKVGDDEMENEADKMNRGFAVLIGYTLFWYLVEPEQYQQVLEDLLACFEESQSDASSTMEKDGTQWTDVLIDVLLSILSRPHRHVRAPIQVAFHYFCPRFSFENIQPLLKALKPSETDNLMMEGEEDEDDDPEGPITPGDAQVNGGGDADQWTSSGEESEGDEDENEEQTHESNPVDPEFRQAIEDALGDAAMHSDTESTATDLDDETMLKLDQALATVFRSHLTGTMAKKSARDLAEQAQAFRVRCFDLVFVLLQSQPTPEVITGILLPILHVANESVRSADQKNVFNRARQVIDRIVQSKSPISTSPIERERASRILADLCRSIKEMIEFARDECTNPSVQQSTADAIRFLLKFADTLQSEKKTKLFDDEIKRAVSTYLDEYLNDRQCLTPTCVFTAAFQRRPHLFLENLPKLADAAFSDNVRPFRRHEACGLIGCLLNKEALSGVVDKSDKKAYSAWKHFLDRLHTGTLSMLSKYRSINDSADSIDSAFVDGKPKSDQKPAAKAAKTSDLFEVFSILRTLVNFRDSVPLRKIVDDDQFAEELEKFLKDSPKLAQSMGRSSSMLAMSGKRIKLGTLCGEVIKKLRKGQADEEEKEEDDEKVDDSSKPSKKRKLDAEV